MKFVSPQNDVAFKKIFGNEERKDILISFLNAVLGLSSDREIADIEILTPYQVPRIEMLKYTLLDLRARDKRGVTFIVEMQVEHVEAYKKRFLYYTAKAYSSQIERATDYPRLNQVIFIGILNFLAFEGPSYLTRHLIVNEETCQQSIEDMVFIFIELPRFTKQEEELETLLEKWVYFIKHASDLEVIPANAVDIDPLRAAYEMANRFGWSRAEMEVYDYWDMKAQDEQGAISAAEKRGVQQGLQQGLQQGEQQKAQAIARNLRASGMDTAQVAALTGLSLEEVEAIDE
jgi:predicted transposase/invertase (TIGR01784 family)